MFKICKEIDRFLLKVVEGFIVIKVGVFVRSMMRVKEVDIINCS